MAPVVPISIPSAKALVNTRLESATERAGRAHRALKSALWAFERGAISEIPIEAIENAVDSMERARLDATMSIAPIEFLQRSAA